jgi:hypothetical protein
MNLVRAGANESQQSHPQESAPAAPAQESSGADAPSSSSSTPAAAAPAAVEAVPVKKPMQMPIPRSVKINNPKRKIDIKPSPQ